MSSRGRLFFAASIIFFIALAGLYFAIRTWMPFMWGLLIPGFLSFFFWLFIDRKKVKDFFTTKSTKQGLNMGALILIVFIFLTVVNYLGAKYYKVFDLSGSKVNTLSDQSIQLVKALNTTMHVRFFYKNGSDRVEDNKKQFRDLIRKYQDVSSKINFEFIEMNENAKVTQDYGATRGSGEAFVDYKGSKNRIENYTEQDLTNAIIKVTRTEKKNIYFIEGHAERNTDQEKDEAGLFGFKQLLEKNSYATKKISIATESQIPKDVHAVLILGPQQNFQSGEVKVLENYLENGGALFLALEKGNTAGLQSILDSVGLKLESFYVFNVYSTPMGQVVNAQSPTVAVNYSSTHPATKIFGLNQMTVFSQPNALVTTPISENIKAEILVKTPANSVALKNLDSEDYTGKPQSFNLAIELKGKYKKSDKEFTVIAFSDVDFLSNLLLYQNLNRDLALNAIASLVKETDLISLSPKEPLATKILVAPPEMNQFLKFVIVGIFFPLPLVFMILSSVLWYRRRHA